MEDTAPFELLKTYPGIIYRQPLFIVSERLDVEVDGYHLSFLDKTGEALSNDSEVPTFMAQLTTILPTICDKQKVLLSIPESWQEALSHLPASSIKFTLDITGKAPSTEKKSALEFASHAEQEQDDGSVTLLIDMAHIEHQNLSEHLSEWRSHHKVMCATNVNAHDEYTFCQSQKLDLVQGQFYTQPAEKNNKKISPSSQTLLELLVKLQDPDVDPADLAETINQDVTLSYKLLRLINSAFFGLPKEIESIKQAIVMLGQNKIKTWASLLSLSGLDDKPNELRIVAMTRARMTELLAKYYKGQAETFFAAGLFSTLDALMDKPLALIIERLPLSDELNQALLNRTGAVGRALQDAINYEKGDWAAVEASPLPIEVLVRAYLDAIHWAKELSSQLHD
ncbi:histidine kinase [Methylophaga sp. 42_25_T18]|nr:histidine kinase [Methylophaga sp. 42_25_T18]OUR88610.1 histidine kinase [Methylophaga sp. 42_8_T64]